MNFHTISIQNNKFQQYLAVSLSKLSKDEINSMFVCDFVVMLLLSVGMVGTYNFAWTVLVLMRLSGECVAVWSQ